MRAYLGYLRDEQEVVDDRVSRREIKREYYQHNSNRIYALRQMALKIARESNNDYLPELEAVSQGELDQLFEAPPTPADLRVGETLEYKFKFLGTVAARGERFFLFARLDPYEQAEARKNTAGGKQAETQAAPQQKPQTDPQKPQADSHATTAGPTPPGASSRPRRVSAP